MSFFFQLERHQQVNKAAGRSSRSLARGAGCDAGAALALQAVGRLPKG